MNPLNHFPPTHTLTTDLAAGYLSRLNLPPALIGEKASLPLLSQLLLSHLEEVPKDTTPLHVATAQWAKNERIVLGSNFAGMPTGIAAYDRIVEGHAGAFCFGLNPTFASLLRAFGFRVSEMVTRCYQALGQNPETHELGWKWGTLSHECLVCDWEGSGQRYLVDVGFGGGGCSIPVPFVHGTQIMGLGKYEAFKLECGDLPSSPSTPKSIDTMPGWTLQRRVPAPGNPIVLPITSDSPGYWSSLYHFLPITVSLIDFSLYHHFSASHPFAAFTYFFLVTRVLPGTGGARRSLMYSKKDAEAGRTKAKIHTTGGDEAKGSLEERDVDWVEMETGEMRKHLEEEWGFLFEDSELVKRLENVAV